MLEGEKRYIEEAQDGNQGAFGKLYEFYLPKIYRFILLKVTHKNEAEDLVHEVFLNAWQNLHSYTARGFPFSSWLYQIARNEVIDFYRTRKFTARLDDLEDFVFKVAEQQSQELNHVLDLEKVQQFIARLTSDQQDVLIMRFVEDLSHREIAATLAKSEGAIRLIQYRAIQTLKQLIEKKYGPLT